MSVQYAYIRCSTEEQHEERQVQAIKQYNPNIPAENIFIDKMTGKTYDRPNYTAMKQLILNIQRAYSGSEKNPAIEVIIEELDRLGRTKAGILEELRWFAENHIRVRILEIPTTLMDIDASNDWVLDMINKIIIEVYASLAEQEMEKRIKRQREGIEVAKLAGKYTGRKPIKVDEVQFEKLYKKWKAGEITAVKAMKQLDLKPNTFYRRVQEYEGRLPIQTSISKSSTNPEN